MVCCGHSIVGLGGDGLGGDGLGGDGWGAGGLSAAIFSWDTDS